jgi:hypothetical protein
MSETMLRVAARRRVIDLLRAAAPDDVGVFYAAPENWHEKKVIIAGGIAGPSEIRVLTQGRKRRFDQFTLELIIMVGPGAAVVYDEDPHIDPGLAEDPRLVDGTPLDGGLTASVSAIDGPNPRLWTEGPGSEARVVVSFDSHLR